jgi:hypothetical protein
MAVIRGWDAEIEGLIELEAQFERVGKMPKKYLTRSAKAGMKGPLTDARANAPVGETGILKKSIKQKMETPNKRNKSVYRLAYSTQYTDHFRKPTTGVYGGKTPYAYYPSSVEYGYKTKNGRVAGQYAMSWAVHKNEDSSLKTVVNELNKAINELTSR